MSQFESQFEQDLYRARLEKLEQIAALARSSDPSLTDADARYPNHFRFYPEGIDVPSIKQRYDNPEAPVTAEHLEADPSTVAIAGRLVAIRLQGKAGFAQLQQGGQRLQIYVRKDDLGSTPEQSEALFSLYKLLDLGDHIGVRGHLMRTRTGELTLKVSPVTLPGDSPASTPNTPATTASAPPALTFLTKALLPLPDKYSGLGDIELRYRRRYLDLFTDTGDTPDEDAPASTTSSEAALKGTGFSPSISPLHQQGASAPEGARLPARTVFEKRAAILRSIRRFFDTRNFLEVETPMLHTISGGAAARTFETHHNALDIELKLRIAPELYLKRLVVGGFDRVYEINRNFRNEGLSPKHNPEFTMLEFYQAYANYHDLMDLTKELIAQVARDVNGTTLTTFNGVEIDLAPENWRELSMREAIINWWPPFLNLSPRFEDFENSDAFRFLLERTAAQANQTHALDGSDAGLVAGYCQFLLGELVGGGHYGRGIANLFEFVAEKRLIQPTIIYDFPLAVSPLSKVKPDEPDWVERFEFYIGGFEVGNAFSELNDPDDQRRRFEAQLEERKRGDDEAMAEVDEDYVRALGYGLPPTAGEGIGIDRLTMILTGSRSIRDVILFPLMRPHKATEQAPSAS